MALRVVDRLQTVNIDEGEYESPIRSAGSINLPLQIDQAAVSSKRSGQGVNAGLRAIAGGLTAIVCRALAITRSVNPVAGCRLAVAGRLFALARTRVAVESFAIGGRTIAALSRAVAPLGRSVVPLGSTVSFDRRPVAVVTVPRHV